MATTSTHRLLCHTTSLFPSPLPTCKFPTLFYGIRSTPGFRLCSAPYVTRSSRADSGSGFTWEDALRISHHGQASSPDLGGFFEKINICNRGMEMQSEFIPFVIEGQIVGYVHKGLITVQGCFAFLLSYADHLRRFQDVFIFQKDGLNGSHLDGCVSLDPSLRTSEDRTTAVGYVVKSLGKELIPGIRNELYPVKSSFGAPALFALERAAAPYFGIKAYGVHMNGYVEREGQKCLWVGKRSRLKPNYPGLLDHLVAGGLPDGMACMENLVKECEEEAGIPRRISNEALPVGVVSYMDIDGHRFKRDVLFCYDLKLPEDFIPKNQDGEVESFKLLSVRQVADIIRRTHFFKPNCSLVIIDFLFRNGYIRPEELGYLELLRNLRSGDCS